MSKHLKTRIVTRSAPLDGEADEADELAAVVAGLFDVLGRHHADPTDGVVSLVTAFIQGADRVLQMSTPEDAGHNRAALLTILAGARRFVENWPERTSEHWTVH